MPRSIWTGAISFGLVTVPVRLSPAVRRQDGSFHQLHDHDGARIQHRRFCSEEEREVPREEIVRGYELEGGRYVTVTDEELERLDPDRTHTIDIERFVDLGEIDPVLYDSSYHAIPDGEIAAKPYELLRRAMAQSGRVAIGRVVIRTKEHLAALRPTGDLLTVSTMLFPARSSLANRSSCPPPAVRRATTRSRWPAGSSTPSRASSSPSATATPTASRSSSSSNARHAVRRWWSSRPRSAPSRRPI
jgi:Ku protein